MHVNSIGAVTMIMALKFPQLGRPACKKHSIHENEDDDFAKCFQAWAAAKRRVCK